MERAYRFVANPVREAQQLMYIFNTLLEQVERNIQRREKEGIDQTQTRVLLKQLLQEGGETPENLQLYRELVIEANTQLGLITMPEEFFSKYKEIIKITSYDELKKVIGEDPRRAHKRYLVQKDNEHRR